MQKMWSDERKCAVMKACFCCDEYGVTGMKRKNLGTHTGLCRGKLEKERAEKIQRIVADD